jgi:hypothetical protein
LLSVVLVLPAVLAFADDPPSIDHQPIPCSIPAKPASVCASITDDAMVAKAKLYFRPSDDKFYSWVEMTFGGLQYCGTLPAPRAGKLKSIDYYIQAIDDQYQSQRTSTFQMAIEPEGVCEFPPIEKDLARARSIKVYGTNSKQGKKLNDAFDPAGATFVPVPGS